MNLTERELQIVELIAKDMANKTIAQLLGIELRTVKAHVKHAKAKLGTQSRVGLAVWFVEEQYKWIVGNDEMDFYTTTYSYKNKVVSRFTQIGKLPKETRKEIKTTKLVYDCPDSEIIYGWLLYDQMAVAHDKNDVLVVEHTL